MRRVSYVDLSAQWLEERNELLPNIEKILASGHYVGSDEVERFEKEAAHVFGVRHVVSLNSGTDALIFGLSAVGVKSGDEVITPPNSFIASTSAVLHLGAKPVFVDVGQDQNINPDLIETAVTEKTKAIMPVHLTGRVADMIAITKISNQIGIPIVEDAAQAAGSMYDGQASGSWGSVGCFSAHPLKNLNACGDAGFITTNDAGIAKRVRLLRNHGLIDRDTVETFGYVSRMDSIQAAILRSRLLRLPKVVERRRENADLYRSLLHPEAVLSPPPDRPLEFNTWHTFVIQVNQRDELRKFLASRQIETAIHYPVPIHLQPAVRSLGYRPGDYPITENQASKILSLPIHQHLTKDQIQQVAQTIHEFYGF